LEWLKLGGRGKGTAKGGKDDKESVLYCSVIQKIVSYIERTKKASGYYIVQTK